MNEHLPECPVEKRLRAGRTVGSQTCICGALRACEERVMDTAVTRLWDYLQHDVADGWMPRTKADGIITTIKGHHE